MVIESLKRHPEDKQIQRQGLALLVSTISPDPFAKFSIPHARQMMLANGVVEVVEVTQQRFRAERDIQATAKAILNAVAQDYS